MWQSDGQNEMYKLNAKKTWMQIFQKKNII